MDGRFLTRLAAFVEYTLRPLSEDWRMILDRIHELDLPITPQLIERTAMALGLWHVVGEVIRAFSYITITWIIASVCRAVLLQLS